MPRISQAPGGRAEGRTDGVRHLHPVGHCSHSPLRNQRGQVVASIDGQVLWKRVAASRHMLRQPPAWAWDKAALTEALRRRVTHCRIEDTDTGRAYVAPLAFFWTKGFEFDRGHGEQVGLALGYWQVTEPGEPAPRQLTMFEVAPA